MSISTSQWVNLFASYKNKDNFTACGQNQVWNECSTVCEPSCQDFNPVCNSQNSNIISFLDMPIFRLWTSYVPVPSQLLPVCYLNKIFKMYSISANPVSLNLRRKIAFPGGSAGKYLLYKYFSNHASQWSEYESSSMGFVDESTERMNSLIYRANAIHVYGFHKNIVIKFFYTFNSVNAEKRTTLH